MTTHKIVASEVARDQYGYWSHPDLPDFDEGESGKFQDWIRNTGIELALVQMEYDEAADDLFEKYVDGDSGITAWNPIVPNGDGWFLLCIFDTDNGPCAYFARQSIIKETKRTRGIK